MKFLGKNVLSRLVNASYSKIRWLYPADFFGGGGNDGEVYYNNNGLLGHDAGFVYDDVAKTINLGGGTVVASDPVLDMSQTWNNAAIKFDGARINITNLASSNAVANGFSAVLDIAVGGTSFFSVGTDGWIRGIQAQYSGQMQIGVGVNSGFIGFSRRDRIGPTYFNAAIDASSNVGGFAVNSDSGYRWVSNENATSIPGGYLYDLILLRDASGVLAQRSSTSPQTFRIYETYTDPTNYARLAFNTGVAGDWMQIAVESLGAPADNYGIALTPAGTGAISAQVPDNTAAGGNARGTYATDWQRARDSNAAWVASGNYSTISGGDANQATGLWSTISGGRYGLASLDYAVVSGGYANTANGVYSWVPGGSWGLTRGLTGAYAYASDRRAAQGDAQVIGQPVRQTTAANTIAYLTTDGAAVSATNCMILPVNSGCKFTAELTAVHAAGAAVGGWKLEGSARRGAAGDATIVGVATTSFGADAAIGVPVVTVAANVGGAGAGGIVIAITPANATTTYWVGKIELVQAA